MSTHHPALLYPEPQVIRQYWQTRLEAVSGPPDQGAIKYAFDFFAMIRQQEIKAGAPYRYAWELYPQAPEYCCLSLVQAMQFVLVAKRLLVDAIDGWLSPKAQPYRFHSLHLFAQEELHRLQKLYLVLQQELYEVAQEHQIPIIVETIQLEGNACRRLKEQGEKASA